MQLHIVKCLFTDRMWYRENIKNRYAEFCWKLCPVGKEDSNDNNFFGDITRVNVSDLRQICNKNKPIELTRKFLLHIFFAYITAVVSIPNLVQLDYYWPICFSVATESLLSLWGQSFFLQYQKNIYLITAMVMY
jgi:hypothetical protein